MRRPHRRTGGLPSPSCAGRAPEPGTASGSSSALAPAGGGDAGQEATGRGGDRPEASAPRPLRFAMVTTFYPPYSFGGDAIAVQRLARALVRRGHRVAVVHDVDAFHALHRGSPPRRASAEPEGLTVHPLRSGLGVLSPLLTQQTGRPVANGRRIRDILEGGEFDVVHFHNVSLVGGPGVLSLGEGVKVYEAHEHWLVCPTHVLWRHRREVCTGRQCLRCVLRHRRPPQIWRYTGYLERQLEHVDLLLAKSEFSRRKHREFGLSREMEVLPDFLPDDPPEANRNGRLAGEPPSVGEGGEGRASRRDGEAPHDRPYFLFTGRLERIKGLDDVIPLFREYREADLLIAGDGGHGEGLRKLAGRNPRVRFLGGVPPDELSRYYRHAIALLVPSACYETFGMVLIEAFRQGTPVIAREIGPFPEIIRACGGGELFSDEGELVAAMRRMQGDPTYRARLAEAARRGFEEHWSEGVVVPRYLELLGRVAAAKGRHELAEAIAGCPS